MEATKEPGQCMGRLVDDKYFGWFGDRKHKFHLELRCSKPAVAGTPLCGKCLERPRQVGKYHSSLLHNLISEPIPPWSHIFGGQWYEAKVNEYGEPTEAEMARGKKAKEIIYESTITEPNTIPVTVLQALPQIPPPKPIGIKKVDTFTSLASVESDTQKKRGRPRKNTLKDIPATPSSVVSEPPVIVQAAAIELDEAPMTGLEVVKIVLRKFKHEGRDYFISTNDQRVYSKTSDSRPGALEGRWNTKTRSIQDE